MITFVIPSYNNLRHLKNAFNSIQKNAPLCEIILIDDGSTDGSWFWMQQMKKMCANVQILKSDTRVGHTILYDKGIELAKNEIVGIMHADMIIGPNYVENTLKHLKPGIVVCATRIEPPLHPEGKEKIIQDFGMDFDDLKIDEFESFCISKQVEFKDATTKGMFAPWIIYKKDFDAIGGHDPLFAPFPYEDSDIFQRWLLAGYELVQSRDAFVYHLTCRGHRWNDEIGKDDEYFKKASFNASRNYIRKWGSWIKNDEFQHPIIIPKYNISFEIKNCTLDLLNLLEPWCAHAYTDLNWDTIKQVYIRNEQPNTKICLYDKIFPIDNLDINQNILQIDGKLFTQDDFKLITLLQEMISDSGEIGTFELGTMKLSITRLSRYTKDLIKLNPSHTYC